MEIQDRPEQLNSFRYGGIAQLGERLLCKQEVNGSIPFISTMQPNAARRPAALCGGKRKPSQAGEPEDAPGGFEAERAASTARREEKSGRQLENWLRKAKSAAAKSRELGRLSRDETDCDRGYVAKGTGSLEAGDMGL